MSRGSWFKFTRLNLGHTLYKFAFIVVDQEIVKQKTNQMNELIVLLST